MKKFFLVSAAILVLLLITFFGYFRYKQHTSYQAGIHKDASALVKIDVYNLYKSLAAELLKSKKGTMKPLLKGVELPAHIFIYSVKSKAPTTLFSSIKIDDPVLFDKSLKENSALRFHNSGIQGIQVAGTADGRWTIAYDSLTVAIAFSYTKEKVADMLAEIIQHKNQVAVNASTLKGIADKAGTIVYWDGKHEAALNFDKGKIVLKAGLDTKMNSDLSTPLPVLATAQDNAVSLWGKGDLRPLLEHKSWQLDSFVLHGDSLLRYYKGQFAFDITGPMIQKDSIITYEYNDDFEKEEQVSVKETTIPGIRLWLAADTTGLLNYLKHSGILADGNINRKVFPLCPLQATRDHNGLSIASIREYKSILQKDNSGFFGLHIRFERLMAVPELAPVQQYLKMFRSLDAQGAKGKDGKTAFEAVLEFKDSGSHPLLQLAAMR